MSKLRSVDEQLRRVLADLRVPEPIELALLDAQGLLCAEDVLAEAPLPGFDNSAMDGYAVRAADTAGATEQDPVVLPVVGDIPAGSRAPRAVTRGLCLRIMTGAPVPSGADSIVPVEWTDGGVARVRIDRPATPGAYVRRTGEDIRTGEQADLGRPGVGEILDSNSYALAAAARDAGAEVYRAGIVPDDHARLLSVLEGQLLRADQIVTSGGVSAGAFDVVKEALSELGTVEFVRVAMQPGMPQGFGTLGAEGTPIFCLPGNPVSALVSFEVFVRPAVRLMLGKRRLVRRSVRARSLRSVSSPPGRRQYRRGLLHREADGGYSVEPVGGSGSHLLAGLAQANCLIVIDEEVTEVSEGDQVTVVPLLLASP